MLDIRLIRENPELVKKAVDEKHLASRVDVDGILEIDSRYRNLLRNVEEHRALRNQLSENISKVTGDARQKMIDEASHVKAELIEKEQELAALETELVQKMQYVPNVISEDVPSGKDDSENKVIRSWGEPIKFDFEPKDHVRLGEELDLIDIPTSAKVSGSRFNYLKNEAVIMQFALLQFIFDTLGNREIISELAQKVGNPSDKPFVPVLPPVIIKADVAKKMDRYDPVEDRYYYAEDDVMFVGSAEHSIGPMHMDDVLDEDKLPIRYIGYSTAFRREAGSYGKDTKGILRRHQFDKMEMETFSTPETGMAEQDLIVAVQEYIMQKLGLPHQVVMICTGDMGKPDYRQIDINTWMPGENAYRETHTSDYMTDFQARRLNTRVKRNDGTSEFVHMNDATALALGRALIAIIENYQQKDGSVAIPEVLQPYMNGLKLIKR